MAFIYGDIIQTINEYLFDVVVRSPYVPNLPSAVRDGRASPIFEDIYSLSVKEI